MGAIIYTQALFVVADGAYLRGIAVLLAFARTLLNRRRFVTLRMGWIEILCSFEPLLLLLVTYYLQAHAGPPASFGLGQLCATVLGAALVLAGWGLVIWSFLSWPSIFAGHGVLAEHELMTRGAYGFVRHPVYLGAFLIWAGLTVGFRSPAAFLVTALYVIPVYLLYIRSEEEMMVDSFGDAYRDYRRTVPMLIPALRQAWGNPVPHAG